MLGIADRHFAPPPPETVWVECCSAEEARLWLPVVGDGLVTLTGDCRDQHMGPVKDWRKRLTGRFYTFSRLESPEAVLEFAKEFGYLGVSKQLPLPIEAGELGHVTRGEELADWEDQVQLMRTCIALWHVTQAGDDRIGSSSVEVVPSGDEFMIRCDLGLAAQRMGAPRISMEWLSHEPRPEEVRLFVFEVVLATANSQMQGGFDVQLLRSGSNTADVEVLPATLKHAMWLQFAAAVGDDKEYEKCHACHRYFDKRAARDKAIFCSDACKSRDRRRKQRQ